jgi:hypothetical protein
VYHDTQPKAQNAAKHQPQQVATALQGTDVGKTFGKISSCLCAYAIRQILGAIGCKLPDHELF